MDLAPYQIESILRDVLNRPAPESVRHRVQAFEALIKQSELSIPPENFVVRHHFAPGIYMRELHIPAGMITTGKIHKHACLNILAKGARSTIINNRLVTIEAPHIHLSPPGFKRASYTIKDSVWITVHATSETDVAALEKDLVCDTEEEYQAFLASMPRPPCLS